MLLIAPVLILAIAGVYHLSSSRAAGASPDINGNGIVDVFDLSVLLSKWNTADASSDLNADGTVNVFDLSTLLSSWGVAVSQKPGPNNTGVPAGRTLTVPVTDTNKGISVASNGNVTINKPGVFEDMLIKGRLNIKATDVTIRYSKIEANPTPWDLPDEPTTPAECTANGGTAPNAVSAYGYANFVMEDSEIEPVRKSTYIGNGIHGSEYTLRRVDISGTVDGAGVFNTGATNVLIEDSYIHDLYRGQWSYGHGCDEPTHSDGIQVHYGTNTTIRNNTISANTIDWNGDPANSNAAIMVNQVGSYFTSYLTIDSNWFDYGGCSINVHDGGKTPTIQNFALTNNLFGKNQSITVSGEKCAMIVTNATKAHVTNTFTGNQWEDGSTPVPTVRNGG